MAAQKAFTPQQKSIIANVIGIYQLVGGVLGMGYLLLLSIGNTLFLRLSSLWIIAGIFLLLFTLSMFAGIQLLRKKYRTGIMLSVINQFVQLLSFSAAGCAFKFVAGVAVSIYFGFSNSYTLGVSGELSAFSFSYDMEGTTAMVSINLVPVVVAWFLFRLNNSHASIGSEAGQTL